MGSEQSTLGDLIDASGGSIQTGPFGTKLKASEYTETGVPVISVGEVGFGRISLHDKTPRVDSSIWERMPEYLLKTNDIVFGRKGAVDRSAHIKPHEDGYFLGSDGIRVRLNTNESDPRFIAYQFQTELHKAWMIQHAAGTTMPSLNEGIIRRIPITLPPLPEQKAIAHILGSLDDKIELNRRMNATLEGMAQALFKSWFVDFDPVIDNALAAGNPIPDELADRAEVRRQALANGAANQQGSDDHPTLSDPKSLFPAAFQFTEELGWIPEGWETQTLYDIANFVNGASYKGADFSDSPEALPVIKIAEVKAGVTAQTKFTEVNKGDKYQVENGDILLSWSGNPDTSIDTFIWTDGPGYLNQHIFNVRLYEESERHFVYYQLKYLRPTFAEIARDKQTTGLGHFTAGDMKRRMVFKPAEALLEQFNAAVSSIYARGYGNRLATKTLTKLRDSLLPKLLSGEIQIPIESQAS